MFDLYKYKASPELARSFKATHAKQRCEMAMNWRNARRINPKIARLMWKRIRKAKAEFLTQMWMND